MDESENNPITTAYELYRSKNGGVSKEIFTNALLKSADPSTEAKDEYMKHITSVADFSDMKLSPQTLKIYAILRGEQKIEDQKPDEHEVIDQKLLAEILYQQGEKESLGKLMESNPGVFK